MNLQAFVASASVVTVVLSCDRTWSTLVFGMDISISASNFEPRAIDVTLADAFVMPSLSP